MHVVTVLWMLLFSCLCLQELRSSMKCPTALTVINIGDDFVSQMHFKLHCNLYFTVQLRLGAEDKEECIVTQSMVDRCIQEHFYEFLVHILPCTLPPDARINRKRKVSHSMDESANSFLSAAIPCSPIVLNATNDDKEGGKNSNLNNSNNPLIRTLLGLKSDSRSGTPSPVSFASQLLSSSLPNAKVPGYDLPRIGRPPKPGRPRSKSTANPASTGGDGKKPAGRTRSSSSIQSSLANHNTNESSPNSLLNISQYCAYPYHSTQESL